MAERVPYQHCTTKRCHVRRAGLRAAALFEVVVSLSILMVAMAVVGATFRNGAYHVELAERLNQANTLTERLLCELDLGLLPIMQPVAADQLSGANRTQEISGWFAEDAPPGMSWKIEVAADQNVPGVMKVGVHIFLGDPDGGENRQQRLLTTYVFRAEPRSINLQNDFGIEEEQLALITDAIPGGAAMFDPNNFDPRAIAQLDLDTLRELLPILMAAFGGEMGAGQLDALMQMVQRGDMAGLQKMAEQAGGGQGGLPGVGAPAIPGGGGTGLPQGGRRGGSGGSSGQRGERGGGK